MRCLTLALMVGSLAAISLSHAAEQDESIAQDEKVLKDAGLPADDAGLLEYFRKRTLSEQEQARLGDLVRKLGDNSFSVREKTERDLVIIGRPTLSFLKAAVNDTDLEIASRATRCIEKIESAGATLQEQSAARLLGSKKTEGAAEVIVKYLPFVDEESVEEELVRSLGIVGVRDGKALPALVDALGSKHTTSRAAAALILGRNGDDKQRAEVRKLLGEKDLKVRLRAAQGLVLGKDKDAVPALIELLDTTEVYGSQAEELLFRIGGEKSPQLSLGTSAEDRKKCRDAWQTWWKENGPKADLASLDGEERVLGLTMICDYEGNGAGGLVWECGKDGKERWKIEGLQGPADAHVLRGGRVLIAENSGGKVTERDKQGKVVWECKANGPVSCQRLPNGNTFVAGYNEVFEINREGKKVVSHAFNKGGSIYCALRLRNGNVLIVSSNNLITEIDAAGKEIRTTNVNNTGGWGSIELLPNGRFLVALYSSGKVVEIDNSGKIFWEQNVTSPCWASRLRNGNTLVTETEGRRIVELDRTGKKVWEVACKSRPFRVRRY